MPFNPYTDTGKAWTHFNRDWGIPFATQARSLYPVSMAEVFNWAEFLWMHQGVYSRALQRAVRYFMTTVEIVGTRDFNVRSKYRDFFLNNLNVLDHLSLVGDDLMCYGNSFTSVYKPFHRDLVCPECSFKAPASRYDYTFTDYYFNGKCDRCRKKVKFDISDTPAHGDELRLIRWNPRTIEIEYHPLSGETCYYYEPHSKDKAALAEGSKVAAENTPEELLVALRQDKKFKFSQNAIYHMKTAVPASFIQDSAGWGLPLFLPNFEYVVQLQMLTKYNEAIINDYLVPIRFLSPPSGGGAMDPLLTVDSGRFMRSVENMWKEHRRNPASIHSIPFPVQYQALGGEARSLAAVELLKFAANMLLTSMGVPQELQTESMSSGGPPIGLRMFERSWTHFVSSMNNYLDWLCSKCSDLLLWEKVSAQLLTTSIHEDEMARQLKMQLLAGNQISRQTAFSAFNIDFAYESDKILEEQAMMNDKMQTMQREEGMAAQQQQILDTPSPQGGSAPGGAPAGGPPGAGGPPAQGAPSPQGGGTLEELMMQADQEAQQLLTMPPANRRSRLLEINKSNEALSALVKQRLSQLEQVAAQNGVNLTRQGQIPPGQRV
jgi:hypothetical protein